MTTEDTGPWSKYADQANASAPADDGPWAKYQTASVAQPSEPAPPPAPSGLVRRVLGDQGINAAKGILSVGEAAVGLADIPTFGLAGKAGEAVGWRPKAAKAMLSEYYSPEQKTANEEVANAEGFFDTAAAMLRNPSTIVGAAVESAPLMVGGGAIARGVAKAVPSLAGNLPALAGIGEGAVIAGSSAEQIRQNTEDGELTGKQVLSALGAGVGGGLLGAMGGKLAGKLGIADPDVLVAGGAFGEVAKPKGLFRRALEGAVAEGVLEEAPQSMQEQVWQNVALDRPLGEGVPEATAAGMLAGGLMGGGVSALTRPQRREPAPVEETQGQAAPVDPTNSANLSDAPAAPVVPNPGAAPGTLADAANAIAATQAPAVPAPAPVAPPAAVEAPAEAAVAPIGPRNPPPAPWLDTATGEITKPTAEQVTAAMLGYLTPRASAGQGMKIDSAAFAAQWGIAPSEVKRAHREALQVLDAVKRQSAQPAATEPPAPAVETVAAQQEPVATETPDLAAKKKALNDALDMQLAGSAQAVPADDTTPPAPQPQEPPVEIRAKSGSYFKNVDAANRAATQNPGYDVRKVARNEWVLRRAEAVDAELVGEPTAPPAQSRAITQEKTDVPEQVRRTEEAGQEDQGQGQAQLLSLPAPESQPSAAPAAPALSLDQVRAATRMPVPASAPAPLIAPNAQEPTRVETEASLQAAETRPVAEGAARAQGAGQGAAAAPRAVDDATYQAAIRAVKDRVERAHGAFKGDAMRTRTAAFLEPLGIKPQTSRSAQLAQVLAAVEQNPEAALAAFGTDVAPQVRDVLSARATGARQSTQAIAEESRPAFASDSTPDRSTPKDPSAVAGETPPSSESMPRQSSTSSVSQQGDQQNQVQVPSPQDTPAVDAKKKALDQHTVDTAAPTKQPWEMTADEWMQYEREELEKGDRRIRAEFAEAQRHIDDDKALIATGNLTKGDKISIRHRIRKMEADLALRKATYPATLRLELFDITPARHARIVAAAKARGDVPSSSEEEAAPQSPVDIETAIAQTPPSGGVSASGEANQRQRITPDIAAEMKPGDVIVDENGNEYRAHAARHDWLEAHPIVNGKAQINADSRVTFLLSPEKAAAYPERLNVPIYATGRSVVDAAAAQAATSPANDRPEPTDAQKEAGNYAKGHVIISGLDISIENEAGTKRRPEWPTLASHYGYIKGTIGKDKDHVDVFVKPGTPTDWAGTVFVVDQRNKDRSFDEHKVMLGFDSIDEAKAGYLANYTKGWTGLQAITAVPFEDFKTWVYDQAKTKSPFAKPAPEPRAKAAKKPKAPSFVDVAEAHYVPGRVLQGYGPDMDEVLAFDRGTDGGWSVTVHQVKRVGDQWVRVGKPWDQRVHSTAPNPREIKRGPIAVLEYTPGEQVPYSEPRSDGKPFQDAPARGARPQDSTDAPTDANAAAPEADKAKPAPEKIEDFGEVLHGARKHYAAAYADRVKDAQELDLATEPLSKTWPEPEYDTLLKDGADPFAVAWVHAARDEIPPRPKKSWKLRGWVQKVSLLRDVSMKLLDGRISADQLREKLSAREYELLRQEVGGRADLYEAVGHDVSLKGVTFAHRHYLMYHGQNNVNLWVANRAARATAMSNWPHEIATGKTKEEAIANFRAWIAKQQAARTEEAEARDPEKMPKFVIYSRRGQQGFIIGVKIRGNGIDLHRTGTAKEAREYLDAHAAELAEKFRKMKDVPFERGRLNAPRVGIDHRNGADVTPQQFSDTFGFRGVQFGNYVEGARRQLDMNNAYDALMDLAGVIDVPPKALSLNGTLGLAFGARGKGGKHAAAAHFERDTIVINLTKGAGAGSLAHEWFHGLDNYFSRLRGQKAGMATTATAGATGDIRPEMVRAFQRILNAIDETGVPARSRKLDGLRSKDYWSTTPEMSARVFESYVIAKLADQSGSNDYLANVVSDAAFDAAYEPGNYPYPTPAEIPTIRAAFDEFFDVVQTKETDDGKVALFSRPDQPVPFAEQVRRRLASGDQRGAMLDLGRTPAVLRMLGFGPLPLRMSPSVLFKIATGKGGDRAGLSQGQIARLPELIDDPVAVFVDPQGRGLTVVTSIIDAKGNPVIVGLQPNLRERHVDVNILATAFGQDNSQAKLEVLADGQWLAYAGETTNPRLSLSGLVKRQTDAGKVGGSKRTILGPSDLRKFRAQQRGEVFSRPPGAPTNGTPKAAVDRVVSGVTKGWRGDAPTVRVLATAAELPASARRQAGWEDAEGFYDPATGTAYLVAANLRSTDRALQVLAHEVIGHYGMEAITGPAVWAQITDTIGKMRQNPKHAALFAELERRYGPMPSINPVFVREAVAVMAEKGVRNSVLDRVVASLRAFLRRMGFVRSFSEAELRQQIVRAARHVARGGQSTNRQAILDGSAMASKPDATAAAGFGTLSREQLALLRQLGLVSDAQAADLSGNNDANAQRDARGFRITTDEERARFLSSFPEDVRFGSDGRSSRLRAVLAAESERAVDELGGKAEGSRVVGGRLGPFTGYRVTAEIAHPGQPHTELRVMVYGDEQIAAGLKKHPALTFTISRNGELSVNGPPAHTDTYKAFEARGWAEPARGKDGAVMEGWTALRDPEGKAALPVSQLVPLLADVHARMRTWKQVDRVGLHWSRVTGATGGPAGRETAIFFSKPDPAAGGVSVSGSDTATPEQLLDAVKLDKRPLSVAIQGGLKWLKEKAWLPMLPLNYLADYAPTWLPQVTEFMRVKRLMDALRGELHAEANDHSQKWLKLVSADRAGAAEAAKLMHDATLANTDPAEDAYKPLQFLYGGKPYDATPQNGREVLEAIRQQMLGRGDDDKQQFYDRKEEIEGKVEAEKRRPAAYATLRERFLALPPAFQELFVATRDLYKKRIGEWDQMVLDNIDKAGDLAVARADREREAAKEAVRDAGDTGKELADAYKRIDERFDEKIKNLSKQKQVRFQQMREMFESERISGPYFPLFRTGDYFVAIREKAGEGKAGKVISFSRFKSLADRDWYVQQVKRQIPDSARKWDIKLGVMSKADEVKGAVDTGFVVDVEALLTEAGSSSAVKDAIWQRYLQTLPDFSQRKNFIHRKGTHGYSADALQAFGSQMFHMSHQMAKLKYSKDLENQVELARHEARNHADSTDADMLINELQERLQWIMNPTAGSVAQSISGGAFVWNLAISPAAAIVNWTQTVMIGIPVLGARLGGYGAAAREIMRASAQLVRAKDWHVENVLEGGEKLAMEAFFQAGLLDRTHSHALAGVGEQGVEYSAAREKWMGKMSFLFHHVERINRETTALAAYRLARKQGQAHQQAIDTAMQMTWRTHFDLSNSSRARYLKSDFAKVIMTHRSHILNMSILLFQGLRRMLKDQPAEVRKEASKEFFGIMGMHALMAGVAGVPFYGITMIAAGLLSGLTGDDDERTPEDRLKKAIYEAMPEWMASTVLYGAPSTATGLSLYNRIGFPDLFFRSADRELEGKSEAEYWIMQVLGPAVGIIPQMWNGLDQMRDGHIQEGVEKLMPKAVRDPLKAWRFGTEGVLTLTGDAVVDEVNAWEIIGQANGFAPFRVSEAYEKRGAKQGLQARILARRARLMNTYALGVRLGDRAMMDEAQQGMRAFNKAYPEKAITVDSIRQSLRARARRAALADDGGVVLDQRLANRIERDLGF